MVVDEREANPMIPEWLPTAKLDPQEVVRLFFHESRNPLRRLRCRVFGHRSSDITGFGPLICRWCWKVAR